MTINNIKIGIRQFIVDNHTKRVDIYDADIYDDIGLDSLGFVQLIIFCEDTFGYKFDIEEMDFEKLRTIRIPSRLQGAGEDYTYLLALCGGHFCAVRVCPRNG